MANEASVRSRVAVFAKAPVPGPVEDRLEDFAVKGVDVIALSSDTLERAKAAKEQLGLAKLTVGYGFAIAAAREWGLHISRDIKDSEPDEFVEPGVFLVKPDGTLYCASINTMPFARPSFQDVVNAVEFVTKNNYPARGEA